MVADYNEKQYDVTPRLQLQLVSICSIKNKIYQISDIDAFCYVNVYVNVSEDGVGWAI